ncbi:2,3-diketo-L-gulonate-binding periplasmic protein YiaO precursor [Sporomusa ovata DSM 2662]|uniref:TRAP-type C4-dicarboxylate transport system, periplasmic component n=1 Tax=Sporomusa ovata TaxID=2378 RepID=A0A0U1KWI4_9FIRM|nr:C4-dicarboxylate TRAP transporter substrate-binding protein [Sporomusa ovata]EQB28256.1 trap dicarboxylate transporter, dctp subunit [Sporomusa ovata DSM 2662]CQR71798.1 TRAP transporter solute receptor, unknown substrate 8 [Sporomusa ovata]
MKETKKLLSMLLILIIASLLVSACVKSKETVKPDAPKPKYVILFNHALSESEPFHQGFLKWAQRVKERTNGEVEIQVFHSGQLGVEEDIIEQLKQGAPIGQNTDAARISMYVPAIAVLNAPYFVETIEDVAKLRELPTIKLWEKELEDKYGIKVLSFCWVQGMRHILTNRPIKTPEDLKGLCIRTPGAPIWQQSIRALGAAPVAMPFGEVYPGMQQKAIDGVDLVYRNVTGAKLFETAKYMSETNHILHINFEVMSKKYFDSLPPEYQQILIEECNNAGMETSKKLEQEVETIRIELTEKGMTIVQDVDLAAFRKAGEQAYKVLGLTEVRDKLYEERNKQQ